MSKNEFVLEATPRSDIGKGASRRLRRLEDSIPAVIYGAGKEPTSITLLHKDIMHAIENEAFFSHVVTINVGKKKETVVIKDLQRHPAKPRVMHADFLRIKANQAINIKVPLHFTGEEECVGVKLGGGQINHLMNELEISCLPKDLPEFIEVPMEALELGESLHITDLTLPKGVTSVDLIHGEASNHAIAAVHAPKGKDEDEEEAEAAAAAAEGEESTDEADSAE